MIEPLGIVGLDREGTVCAVRRLEPGGVVRLDGAAFVIELPDGAAMPDVGQHLILWMSASRNGVAASTPVRVTGSLDGMDQRPGEPTRRGRLVLCSTPIGNLGDASPRLAETLGRADVVFAEDTRRTGKLLAALGVSTPLRSYFVGNEHGRAEELRRRLTAGETVALATDAGTPAVADPGLTAVRVAREVGAVVSVVPGPSAVTAALAASGLSGDRFVFEGFLPRKGGDRTARLATLATEDRTIVLFSATRRVDDDLAALAEALGTDREVVVARELTKLHEELWFGTLGHAAEHWGDDSARGEFTLVIAGAPPVVGDLRTALADVLRAVESGEPLSQAVKDAAQRHGVRRRELYDLALSERDDATSGSG